MDPNEIYQAAVRKLWESGDLRYKLHADQKKLSARLDSSTSRKFVLMCGRRYGKTTFCCIKALEYCIRNKNARVVYAAPTSRQAEGIILPIMRKVLEDCPDDLKPVFREHKKKFIFANGSEIDINGADDNMGDNLRGPYANLVIADECGFWRHCAYVITNVLFYQTVDCNGRMILISTPPKSNGHEFIDFVNEAKVTGNFETRTTFDNPILTDSARREVIEEVGGESTVAYRRECLCELITDPESAVIPEFNNSFIVKNTKRPPGNHIYVYADWGVTRDFSHVLFGHHDYNRAKFVFEDELVFNYALIDKIYEKIREKEIELWGENEKPTRVSDTEARLLNELKIKYNMSWGHAKKDDRKEVDINRLRQLFAQWKIEIDEKCKVFIAQLWSGIWKNDRSDYERSAHLGHLDGIDAARYGLRLLNWNRQPNSVEFSSIYNSFNIDAHKKRTNTFKRRGLYGHGRTV